MAERPFRVRRSRHPRRARASPWGRIFERTPDGTELDWGAITLWSPPTRVGYLWHIQRDRRDATDVELTFVDVGNGRTRLDIVHAGWERLGAEALAWRDANTDGWDSLIPRYVEAAEERRGPPSDLDPVRE